METPQTKRIIIIIPGGKNGTDLARLLISHGAKLTTIATTPQQPDPSPEPDKQLVVTAATSEQSSEPK